MELKVHKKKERTWKMRVASSIALNKHDKCAIEFLSIHFKYEFVVDFLCLQTFINKKIKI